MECPFELPVKKAIQSEKLKIFRIITANNKSLVEIITSDQADYIVQAINSHEKLTKIMQISYEAICTGDQEASDKAIGLIEDYAQALKEAEKQ